MTLEEIEKVLINIPPTKSPSFNSFEINGHQWIAFGPRHYFKENPQRKAFDFAEQINKCSSLSTIINLMTAEEKNEDPERYKYKEYILNNIHTIDFECWNNEMAASVEAMTTLLSLAKEAANQVKKGKAVFVHCGRGLQRTATFIAIAELLARDPKTIKKKSCDEIRQLIFKDLEALAKTAFGRMPSRDQLKMLFSEAFIENVKTALF